MKKIPTLFKRIFENHKIVDITDEITPGCEDAFYNGIATIKIDGSACAIINGILYKRYDAKEGRTPPEGAIPCCNPDPETGHWPHWVEVDPITDKWLKDAYFNTFKDKYPSNIITTDIHFLPLPDGTYEAIGKHFNSNPYNLDYDVLVPHGTIFANVIRDFDHVKSYLEEHEVEGLVFWLNNKPVCKIKRTDFGLPWGKKNRR